MALDAESVHVTYPGGRHALRGVSCAALPGRITAVVGPNGGGKSTLLRTLGGVRRPNRGEVRLDGRPLEGFTPRERARRIALVAQQPQVAFDFDARTVVGFGPLGSGGRPDATDRAIERFGLGDLACVPFGSLSVGQRQRVSLARAVAQLDGRAGSFLLADEPIAAMDPRHAAHALAAFADLARGGVGVLLVLHDLSAAARIAEDAVLLTGEGRCAGSGRADTLLDQTTLSRLFGTPMVRTRAPGLGVVIAPGDPPAGASV